MEPENLRFGGGAAETLISPLVAVWLLIAIVLILTLPRQKAIVVFLAGFFLTPLGQVVLVGGLHFTVLRILIVTGLARIVTLKEPSTGGVFPGGFNSVDRVAVLWTMSTLTVMTLQYMAVAPLIKNLGDFLDALGGYLVVRFMIPDRDAITRTIKVLALITVVLGICMINEQINHINVFGVLGGTSSAVTIRDGSIRSSGTLGCLYAGVFGGACLPLFLGLWKERTSRIAAFAGLVGATTMMITSYSSVSWMAYGASIVGLAFWPLRRRMRLIRWGFALTLLALHLAMKAPVWALIARVDLTGSSSSYHRMALVDNCIRHFGDWWLLGTVHYNDWGWGMWDICNQFVAVALTGGLASLVFYVAMFSRSFGAIGKARKKMDGNRGQEWFLWCLGTALFSNVVSSFGINYMAPMLIFLFPLLACISVATLEAGQTVPSLETADRDRFMSASSEVSNLPWLKA